MGVRLIKDEGWQRALQRLSGYSGRVAFSWAALRRTDSSDLTLLMATVYDVVRPTSVNYRYERLEISSSMVEAHEVADRLVDGNVDGSISFVPPSDPAAGTSYWFGAGESYGATSALSTPSYYYSYQLDSIPPGALQAAGLYDSLAAPYEPYWPTAGDALLEVVLGTTRNHSQPQDISVLNRLQTELVIHLPYRGLRILEAYWLEDSGLVVSLDAPVGTAVLGYSAHLLWQMHASEVELHRVTRQIVDTEDYTLTIPLEAPPLWFAIALVDPEGTVVDNFDTTVRVEQPDSPGPVLPPEALLQAFDFLGSVWQNAFGAYLFSTQRQLATVSQLAQPVTNRSDFESRLSQLDALVKSIWIDDQLIDPADAAPRTDRARTLDRLDAVLKVRFGPRSSEYQTVRGALTQFRRLNRLRVAIQHPYTARADLPTSLAALGLGYPPDWPIAWEVVRRNIVEALAEIRRTLLTSL